MTELGSAHGVRCEVAQTAEPWLLDIDTIVISVGNILGGLGRAIQERFPSAEWNGVDFGAITMDQPRILDLHSEGRLRRAVLVSPHDRQDEADPSSTSLARAARSAVAAAVGAGATVVGMPLLGTGDLGIPPAEVAVDVLSGALNVRGSLPDPVTPYRLVFFGQTAETVSAVTAGIEPFLDPAAWAVVALAGGVSNDLVDPTKGIALTDDRLDFAAWVSMVATVIVDQRTPPPLSIGVFGEWGSGKSYFMGLLREQVRTLAGSANPGYCAEVAQIGFNAWHYADSNLWASLGDEIFRQLSELKESGTARRALLRKELTQVDAERDELRAVARSAEDAATVLRAEVAEAVAGYRSTARDLIKAIKNVPAYHTQLAKVARQLGIGDAVNQGELLATELRGSLDEAELLRRTARRQSGKVVLFVAVIVAVVAAGVTWLAPLAEHWMATVAGGLALVCASLAVPARAARKGLQSLRELTEDLQKSVTQQRDEAVGRQMAALREAETKRQVTEAQLTGLVQRAGELRSEIAELAPGRRLYSFLADRAQSKTYTGNLGLISTIRKDFQQLITLMAEWRGEPGPDRRPIDRIVLYIDDLDRCAPRQVAEVLQAVNLLLALDLFVVVVGVDPRWLEQSLRSHYPDLLGERSLATPEDYLEKIINIPLVLPEMAGSALLPLLRGMADVASPPVGAGSTPASAAPGRPGADERTPAGPVEPGSEIAAQQVGSSSAADPQPLTEAELELFAKLGHLVDTPRKAKRLFNVYRMIRATRDLSSASDFLGGEDQPGQYGVVVLLLGLLSTNLRQAVLDSPARDDTAGGLLHRPDHRSWGEFVADLQPRRASLGWENGVVGTVDGKQLQAWTRLHRGMAQASTGLEPLTLGDFQGWVPVIRRFSYTLPGGVTG